MTTTPKAARFFTRRVERPVAEPASDLPFDNHEDGFGNQDFRRPEDRTAAPAQGEMEPAAVHEEPDDADLAAIGAEGLTGRQLRRARLLAQRHGIEPRSDLDAVLQLRRAGIDPFSGKSMLAIVSAAGESEGEAPQPETGRSLARLPGDQAQLPQRARPMAVPTPHQRAEVNQAAEILKMQQDIARRRRRRLALLAARLVAFVLLPTLLAGWYFYNIATPMYSTKAEFVIQQSNPVTGGAAGGLGGLLSGTALATSQDSMVVQGYLQSRAAMARLEEDVGFRAHFQSETIDQFQRLAPDATMEASYKVYNRFVKIAYDPTEGIVRMEVIAADPEVAATWARQLVVYAEEQVDHLTKRVREEQMREALVGYEEAQKNLAASQERLIALQEKFQILSSETEVSLVVSQIGALETQLTAERLALAQMQSNSNPNQARMEPLIARIAALEDQIAELRGKLTETGSDTSSLAEIQGQLLVAQSDMTTRQMMLTQALQAMETARVEANRQVRYLSMSVSPIATDAPAYPRAFENTLVTLLILLGIYLMISMTAAILREQVSA